MSFLYGASDEKYILLEDEIIEKGKTKLNPLDTFKFKLNHLLDQKTKRKLSEVSIHLRTSPHTLTELSSTVVNRIPLPQAFHWNTTKVVDWIRNIGFPQYQNTFRSNQINGRVLQKMDASYLTKINIKNFDHIREITSSIRKLYGFDKSSFCRSISMPDRSPNAFYKLFRTRSGPKYDNTRRIDLWKKLHILKLDNSVLYENHWQTLETWLKHLPPNESVLFGGTGQKKYNLFYPPKGKPLKPPHKKIYHYCDGMPPCMCNWTKDLDFREPWKLKCLSNCDKPIYSFQRTKHDESKEKRRCLTLLKVHLPHKYSAKYKRTSKSGKF